MRSEKKWCAHLCGGLMTIFGDIPKIISILFLDTVSMASNSLISLAWLVGCPASEAPASAFPTLGL